MGEMNKICMIGIDGGTFDLIEPWVKKGHLPHIRRIMFTGSYGVLKSSIPDNSAPAWTSMITGKNPGKHRVFSFTSPNRDIAEIKITNSRTRGSPSIWDTFSKSGRKVCVINVPLTYPPEQVDGIMISGMDTPSTDKSYTYPESLKHELIKQFGRYKIEPEMATTWTSLSEKGKLAYINEVHSIAELRCRVATYLLEKYPWDFFMVVFVATDRIQHKFWGDMDRSYPFFKENAHPKIQSAIFDTYRLIDSFIGKIVGVLPEHTSLLIVSDHGFGPRSRKVVSINQLLHNHHLLQYKSLQGNTLAHKVHLMKRIGFDLSRRILSPRQQQTLKKLFPFLEGKAFSYLHFASIDWSKTKAFAEEPLGLIWINRKDRFRMGIVNPGEEYEEVCNKILTLLKGINNPETGLPILRYVFRKHEVYTGTYLNEAPDVVFSYSDHFSFPENKFTSHLFKNDNFLGEIKDVREFFHITGIHRPDGIIILNGDSIRSNAKIEDAQVIDVLPTCLYLAGLPLPKSMDGRILTEIIQDRFIEGNPIRYDKEEPEYMRMVRPNGTEIYSPEEQKQIEDRLKHLGYL